MTFLYEINSTSNAIMVTQACNCNCLFCSQPAGSDDNLYDLNMKMIPLMNRRTRSLAFTGGEPTLFRSGFISLLGACKKYLPTARIEVLTNGILLDDFEYARELALLGIQM